MGELRRFPLGLDQKATITMHPAKHIDLGQGLGTPVTRDVQGGVVGVMLDGRGRPLQLPADQQVRVSVLTRWFQAIDLYPKA